MAWKVNKYGTILLNCANYLPSISLLSDEKRKDHH